MNSAAVPAQIGKYWVKKLLGTGGMGRVFLAVDPDIGREVAIKLVTLGSDPQASERFLREAQTMGRLNHPNIVTLLEFGVDHESPFLVLEFLSGEDLSQWMLRPHTLREQVRAMLDVAQAIAAAHKVGVLHRDLKPENVRVLDDGRCKLLDFGIAQSGAGQLTASGYFVGTPEFVAPEVMTGSAHSAAADIYALGLLFYTMLCGSNPFRGDNVQATVARVVQLEPMPLSKRLTGVPPQLSALIHRCLAKQPELRPESADSLVQALTALLAQIHPDARLAELPPPSNTAPFPTTPAPSRTQATAGLGAAATTAARRSRWLPAAVLSLVIAAVAWWWLQAGPPELAPVVAPPRASVQPATVAKPAGTVGPEASQPATTPPAGPATKPTEAAATGAESAGPDRPDPTAADTDTRPSPDLREGEPEPSAPAAAAPSPAAPPKPASSPPEVAAHTTETPQPSVTGVPASTHPETEPAPPPLGATVSPDSVLPIAPHDAKTGPPPAAPVQVQISRFSPRTLRAGRNVTMRLEGSGLAAVGAVMVSVGGAPDPRFRIGALTHSGDGSIEFNLNVARGVPLGSYALVLQGANLRAAPVILEVSL